MPAAAKARLADYGEIVEFASRGITYDAISGHPDIFFCPTPAGLIIAPNLPEKYFSLLDKHNINYTVGQMLVGSEYPDSARYNSLVTGNLIIQNPAISDPTIARLNPGLEIIKVKQGYVRCNLVGMPDNLFITSDRGIQKSLIQQSQEVLYVNPSCIKLDGFENGFIGGACGIFEDKLFICGSLRHIIERAQIEAFAARSGVQIVELYEGMPVDVGTIMFLQGK
jgi:hypothetical protein